MTSKTFTSGTVIDSAWLNDSNSLTYSKTFPDGAKAATTIDLSSSASGKGDALLTVLTSASGSQATTQHQVNDERSSVFQMMTAAQIAAITAETGTTSAICSAALQAGIDGLALNQFPHGTYQLDTPIFIKSGTLRTTIRGDNRIRCILQPNAISISAAPTNVNAMFVIQDNNAHFCMENLRLTSTVGFTGVGIYSVEGGASDATGQCLFSGLFRNLWVDFSSTNSGFLTGGTQNCAFDTITFENMKGVFNLQGTGVGDNFYRAISLYNCYDQFILQTTDTNGAFAMSVDGLHAYNHNRGRLIDVQNWTGGNFNDLILESKTGAVSADALGLARFKNCTGILMSNFYGLARTGVPALNTGLEIEGGSGKFINGTVNALTAGLTLNGTSAVEHEFVNVDFSTAGTSCLVIAAALTGTIRTRGCKFNNAQLRCMVNSVAGSSFNWYSYGDEFINAGLGGNAGSRNLDISTSGTVRLYNPRIGQNNVSAAAGYYVAAGSTGTVDIYDPEWIGTPPSGLIDPASTAVITIHKTQSNGFTSQTAATYTVLESDRDLIANRAGTVTYTLPTPSAANVGRRLNVRTITANTAVSASANVVPRAGGAASTSILAATAGTWAELVSDGSSWQIVAGS
jgi:hypothetical protein